MQNRLCQTQPLLHATRERINQRSGFTFELNKRKHLLDTGRSIGFLQEIQPGHVVQIVLHAQIVVERIVVRQITQEALLLREIFAVTQSLSIEENFARCRFICQRQQSQQRGLSSTVRSDQSVHIALSDLEIDGI